MASPRHPRHSHRPRHLRHRRSRAAHGRPSGPIRPAPRHARRRRSGRLTPSDTLFAVLSSAVLVLAALVVGGLMARPF